MTIHWVFEAPNSPTHISGTLHSRFSQQIGGNTMDRQIFVGRSSHIFFEIWMDKSLYILVRTKDGVSDG